MLRRFSGKLGRVPRRMKVDIAFVNTSLWLIVGSECVEPCELTSSKQGYRFLRRTHCEAQERLVILWETCRFGYMHSLDEQATGSGKRERLYPRWPGRTIDNAQTEESVFRGCAAMLRCLLG